jgi:hypothetical protein
MNSKNRHFLICISGLILFIINNCASSAPSTDKETSAREASSLYYIGTGGKGMRIGILMPQSQGLNETRAYLPTMIQGVLVANISKYSAISVLDRVSLDKVIAETLDPTYEDNFDIVRLGHVTQVGYMMTGRIIRTSTGYSLQINVTDTTPNANTIASYSGTFTAAQLDDQTAIQKASRDLLEQMGVQLTEKAINELNTINSQQSINAQTVLAQGITAQRSGTMVEALTYYYEATYFDHDLVEASSRSSILSADIQSGNLGENVRNDIQRRNAWLKILQEAATFFKNHPPFELLYNPTLTWGKVDYSKETVDISFEAGLFSTEAGFKVLSDLKQGLEKTGRSKDWGFENWPVSGEAAIFNKDILNYQIRAVLINENGKTIGNADGALTAKDGLSFINDSKILSFRNVDAKQISDNLRVSIVSINGMDAKTVGERGYINISTGDEIILPEIFSIALDKEIIVIEKNKKHGTIIGNMTFPSKIGRRPIASIKNFSFNENHLLTSVTIPDTITSIGDYAFRRNSLDNVVIGNGVVTIGRSAFESNKLKSVIIPNSVVVIENGAFQINELTSVIIGNNVTTIGQFAFSPGNNLISITIPTNVNIARFAFSNNFEEYYNRNGKKAGTYLYENGRWNRK